ncbi:hypothetical protein TKK_0010512 [Trichogramma kaykai]|uniref:Uncharacterized protein n=1 Tax=Trichogramma kaykai TaxID=54128 RepID=A0ABD2WY62_9HYME
MECGEHANCYKRYECIVNKLKREIRKADEFLKKCDKCDKQRPIVHRLTNEEKRRIVNKLKCASQDCCFLVEELRMHRAEVKYLTGAYEKLIFKYNEMLMRQRCLLQQIENLYNHAKTQMQCEVKSFRAEEAQSAERLREFREVQKQENEALEKIFDRLVSKYNAIVDECQKSKVCPSKCVEEDQRDKQLFCVVTQSIKQAFDLRAQIENKPCDFFHYALAGSSNV